MKIRFTGGAKSLHDRRLVSAHGGSLHKKSRRWLDVLLRFNLSWTPARVERPEYERQEEGRIRLGRTSERTGPPIIKGA